MTAPSSPPATAPPSLAVSGAHTFGANVIMLAVGFLTSIVLARAAGPEGKGGYDLSLATAGLLVAVVGLALPSGLAYVVARGAQGARPLLSRLSAMAVAQGAGAAVLLLAVSATPLAPAFLASGTGTALVLPITLLFMLTLVVAHERAILVGRQLFIAANTRDLAGRIAVLAALSVVAIVFLAAGDAVPIVPLVWAAVAAAGILVVLFATALPSDSGARPGPTVMREIVSFAIPAYGAQVAQFLNYRLDLFLVGLFLGPAEVGLYALAVSLAQMLWLVSNSVAVVLFARVAASGARTGRERDAEGGSAADAGAARRLRAERGAEAAQVCRMILAATLGGAVLLGLASPVLIPVLFGSAFGPSVAPLLLLLPGVVVFSVANVLGAFVTGIGRPGHVLGVSLVALVVTIPLDLLLIPTVGIVGAALASSAAYSAAALVMLALFTRHAGVGARDAFLLRRSDIALAWGLTRNAAARRGSR